jgi:Zn-dependent protease with chaperone function
MTSLELAVVFGLPAAIAVPHLLPLERVTPLWAAALWAAALALRALTAVGLAVFVLVYLPMTDLFRVVAEWCLHDVLPVLAVHLGLSGHSLAHAASILPGLALAASVLWLAFGLIRAWLALRRRLARALGEGPRGSTIVGEAHILVGATRLGRGRIVVSSAALDRMDSGELAASLAHEEAHIRRRHRPLLLAASLLAALGRALPGTRTAERELAFHLERDADEYAVRHTRDPIALASAICKAATDAAAPAIVALGGRGRVTRRLDYLVDGAPSRGGAFLEGSVRLLAAALATSAILLAVSVPAWATSAPASDPGFAISCPH